MEQTSSISHKSASSTPVFFSLFLLLFLVVATYTLSIMMSPYVVGDLGGSNDIATYCTTIYAVGNALGVPLGGLASRFGTTRLLVACFLLFALFTLLCGLSPTYPIFVVMRFLQGLVCGPFYTLIHKLFSHLAPKEKKEKFTAIIVTIFAVVPVIGACWGGWIAYDYHWQWVFYFNVPIILLLMAFLWIRLKNIDSPEKMAPFDSIGYLFYFIGILCLSFVIMTGQELDWFRSSLITALTGVSILCTVFFILWELHHPNPILDLCLLKKPAFSFALFNLAMLFSAYFGMIILLSLWLTLDVNYTPIWIGLLIGTMAVAGLFPTFLIKKDFGLGLIDCRIALGIAIGFFAISCFHTMIFDVEIDFGRIAISRILAGFGLAFFLPPLFRLCFHSFPEENGVSVMCLFQAVRGLSSGLGAAVYSTMWQRRKVFFHERLGGDLTPFSSETNDFFLNAKNFQLQGNHAKAQLNDFLNRQSDALALDDCFFFMAWLMVGLLAMLLFTLFFRTKAFVPEKNLEPIQENQDLSLKNL